VGKPIKEPHEVIVIGQERSKGGEGYTLYSFAPNSQTGGNLNPQPIHADTAQETIDILNAIQNFNEDLGAPDNPDFKASTTFKTSLTEDKYLISVAEQNAKNEYVSGEYICQDYVTDTINALGINIPSHVSTMIHNHYAKTRANKWNKLKDEDNDNGES